MAALILSFSIGWKPMAFSKNTLLRRSVCVAVRYDCGAKNLESSITRRVSSEKAAIGMLGWTTKCRLGLVF